MDFVFTERFKKSCKKLSHKERKAVQQKLDLMSTNPHHTSLRTKQGKGIDNIFGN
jgi:mRNA-degrading endonuclease RelE of RelBE toxin-antitoxin system